MFLKLIAINFRVFIVAVKASTSLIDELIQVVRKQILILCLAFQANAPTKF